ncbi:MAG: heavy metal-binding domain-containing protein, partial [Ktedonobacteraceae bacterium]
YRPVSLVMGTCVYHVGVSGLRQWFSQISGQYIEMANYTQALYDARELSMERMQTEAVSLKSEGIVGAQIVERNHGWGSHIIEFFAVGTAVISISQDHQIPEPSLSLLLNG